MIFTIAIHVFTLWIQPSRYKERSYLVERMKPVGFVVFGCLTVPKYRQQIEDAYATWIQDALAAKCIVHIFTGEIPADLNPELARLCVNVNFGDNYFSASFKQWRGFEHMLYEVEPCSWYFTCGTDTFVHVHNILSMLDTYKDEHRPLCLGGYRAREIVKGHSVEYFSGGSGIFVNKPALEQLCEVVPEFMDWWIRTEMLDHTIVDEDGSTANRTIFGASDLQLGILCQHCKIAEISLGSERLDGASSYKDIVPKLDSILTCHNMLHDDFYDCHQRIHNSKSTSN